MTKRQELSPSKKEAIQELEEIGSEMNVAHGLTPESTWEEIQDYIDHVSQQLEGLYPPPHVVDEE